MTTYKRFLNEIHGSRPSPTQEQINKCLANEELNRQAALTQVVPAKTLANRLKSYEAKVQRRLTKLNMSYVEWEEQAKKYYTIDPVTFIVTSIAKSPDTDKAQTWPCVDMLDAQERVLKLMDYKFFDHFHRDRDFKWR